MFQDTVKIGDIVRVKTDLQYPEPPIYGKVWHEYMGKTGIIVEVTHDEIPDCERVVLWIEGREAEFFLNEVEILNGN
ncbi:MAG: hypothetical protein CML56_04560 [Rhodobacteraceae bacterium]|nr:hypothetical protein [Paracoccaceae bacterium]|tara:strand:- start:279 stop:509 length:231 start_codon:yes stop_codon:yes gene_type:complete